MPKNDSDYELKKKQFQDNAKTHLQTMNKTSAKIQKDRNNIVGRALKFPTHFIWHAEK